MGSSDVSVCVTLIAFQYVVTYFEGKVLSPINVILMSPWEPVHSGKARLGCGADNIVHISEACTSLQLTEMPEQQNKDQNSRISI